MTCTMVASKMAPYSLYSVILWTKALVKSSAPYREYSVIWEAAEAERIGV